MHQNTFLKFKTKANCEFWLPKLPVKGNWYVHIPDVSFYTCCLTKLNPYKAELEIFIMTIPIPMWGLVSWLLLNVKKYFCFLNQSAANILKHSCLNKRGSICIFMYIKFIPWYPFNIISTLDYVMAWSRIKLLPISMIAKTYNYSDSKDPRIDID